MDETTDKLRSLLAVTRRVTICVDGWSKKGLSASFLGISASFFDPGTHCSRHALLNLKEIKHPHTGDMLANCLEETLSSWNIPASKVMLVISDNGANIVKAIRLMQEKEVTQNASRADGGDLAESESESSHEENEDDIPIARLVTYELPADIPYRRLSCMAHSLQLVIKPVFCHPGFEPIIAKARHIVASIRRSSVLMEKMAEMCGRSVIMDCTTRWNSTNSMLKRLLAIKPAINDILTDASFDTLLASEWTKLEEIVSLLEPFALHTQISCRPTLSPFPT